jgi:choice-of-anchor A domain-containing protein
VISRYHVIAFDSFTAYNGSDVQGMVAVGGNAAISKYSISDQMPAPSPDEVFVDITGRTVTTRNDFVVCGLLEFLSGAIIGGGNLVYMGGAASTVTMRTSVEAPGRYISTDVCPFDFADARRRLRQLSEGLARLTRTGTATMQFTALHLVGTRVDVNVFRVSAADLVTMTEIVLTLPAYDEAKRLFELGQGPKPTTSVVINVLYDVDYTGFGTDPYGTDDADRTPAVNVYMEAFGTSGLLDSEVRSSWWASS